MSEHLVFTNQKEVHLPSFQTFKASHHPKMPPLQVNVNVFPPICFPYQMQSRSMWEPKKFMQQMADHIKFRRLLNAEAHDEIELNGMDDHG